MDWLVKDVEQNGPATTEAEAEQRPVPYFEGQATAWDTHQPRCS